MKKGFIAFTSILVISAVTLSVAVSTALLGVNESKAALTYKKGQETLKIAESCTEEAMLRIRDNSIYSGGSITVGDGTCTIAISGTGADRTITTEATITGPPSYTRNITATIKRAGNSVNIITWQEVD